MSTISKVASDNMVKSIDMNTAIGKRPVRDLKSAIRKGLNKELKSYGIIAPKGLVDAAYLWAIKGSKKA